MAQSKEERKEQKRQQGRERTARRKAAHVCIYCGKGDERTAAGRVVCTACAARQAAQKKQRNLSAPKGHTYQQKYYRQLKARNKCTCCGIVDENTLSGKAKCVACSRKAVEDSTRARQRKKRHKQLHEYHVKKLAEYSLLTIGGVRWVNPERASGSYLRWDAEKA